MCCQWTASCSSDVLFWGFFKKIFILHIVIALLIQGLDAQQITHQIYLRISNIIFKHKLFTWYRKIQWHIHVFHVQNLNIFRYLYTELIYSRRWIKSKNGHDHWAPLISIVEYFWPVWLWTVMNYTLKIAYFLQTMHNI